MPDIACNGIQIHYETFGLESDPPIFLIMGLGVQMILWHDAFCAMLAAKGFRVIRFDNRDVGLSTHLHHLGSPNIPLEYIRFMMHAKVRAPYTLDDMAADTAGLIGALGYEKAHIVGASMGGMIAQNLAASLPARVASLISIMSTTGRRSLPQASWAVKKKLLAPLAKKGDIEGAVQRMKKVFRAISSRTHPPSEEHIDAICRQHVMRANYPVGGARQIVAIAAADDRTHIVRQIKVPTLIIHGEEDVLIPYAAGLETARAIREGGGNANTVIVEGMGHDLPEPLWSQIVNEISRHCQLHPIDVNSSLLGRHHADG